MKIRVKAKEKNGSVDVKMLIKHPMETGRRKDQEGNIIPAKHLTTIKVTHKEVTVFNAHMGTGIAKDPYLSLSFNGKKGDTFEVYALDNTGDSSTETIKIK